MLCGTGVSDGGDYKSCSLQGFGTALSGRLHRRFRVTASYIARETPHLTWQWMKQFYLQRQCLSTKIHGVTSCSFQITLDSLLC